MISECSSDSVVNAPYVSHALPSALSLCMCRYTLLTFVPLNLFSQVSQNMNRYFVLIACLQLWQQITPVAPITTWGPLAIIFAISAIKEGYDDLRRYKADRAANERRVSVLRDGRKQQIQAQQILVGDIVVLHEGEEVSVAYNYRYVLRYVCSD